MVDRGGGGEGKEFFLHFYLRVVDGRRRRRGSDRHDGGLDKLLVESPLLRSRSSTVHPFPGARLRARRLGSGPVVDADARERVGAERDAAVAAADAGAGGELGTKPVPGPLLVQGQARVVPLGGRSGPDGHGAADVPEQRRRAGGGAGRAERRPLQPLDLLGRVEAGAGVVGGLDGRGPVDDGAGGGASGGGRVVAASAAQDLEARGARAVLAQRRAERGPPRGARPKLAERERGEPPRERRAGGVAGDSGGGRVEDGAEAVGGGGGEGGLCFFFLIQRERERKSL